MQTKEEVTEQVKAALVELFEIDPVRVTPEARLNEDLEIDSIDAVDLLDRLRRQTGRKISAEEFRTVRTVGDLVDMDQPFAVPRRDLLAPRSYLIRSTIQMTRGCPHDCEYCSVTAFSGRRFRHRPLDSFVDEFCRLPDRFVFIVDDNILSNRVLAGELFDRLRGAGKWWGSQVTKVLKGSEKIEIVCGVDPVPVVAEKYTQAHGLPVHPDYQTVLDDPGASSVRARLDRVAQHKGRRAPSGPHNVEQRSNCDAGLARIPFADCVLPNLKALQLQGYGHPNGVANTRWASCIAKALRQQFRVQPGR